MTLISFPSQLEREHKETTGGKVLAFPSPTKQAVGRKPLNEISLEDMLEEITELCEVNHRRAAGIAVLVRQCLLEADLKACTGE